MTKTEAKRLKLTKTLEEAHALADRVLSMARRAKPSRPVVPGATREERKAEHRASTGTLREQVWERCGGKCEVSGVELGAAWEMHHLDGGGHRRSRQSLDNVLALSFDVHRAIHRGIPSVLLDVKEACIRLGLREGLAAVQRRIDKAEMVRRTA